METELDPNLPNRTRTAGTVFCATELGAGLLRDDMRDRPKICESEILKVPRLTAAWGLGSRRRNRPEAAILATWGGIPGPGRGETDAWRLATDSQSSRFSDFPIVDIRG
jgi:hypothetical protein